MSATEETKHEQSAAELQNDLEELFDCITAAIAKVRQLEKEDKLNTQESIEYEASLRNIEADVHVLALTREMLDEQGQKFHVVAERLDRLIHPRHM